MRKIDQIMIRYRDIHVGDCYAPPILPHVAIMVVSKNRNRLDIRTWNISTIGDYIYKYGEGRTTTVEQLEKYFNPEYKMGRHACTRMFANVMRKIKKREQDLIRHGIMRFNNKQSLCDLHVDKRLFKVAFGILNKERKCIKLIERYTLGQIILQSNKEAIEKWQ